MIYALDHQRVALPDYRAGVNEYRLNSGVYAYRLSISVKFEENENTGKELYGPVILQVTESDQYVYEDDPVEQQFLELGFWTKSFISPITGWRFKLPEDSTLPALIDFVAYG